MIAIVFPDGRISEGIGNGKRQAKQQFKSYYGEPMIPGCSFAEVKMQILYDNERGQSSMRWVKKGDR